LGTGRMKTSWENSWESVRPNVRVGLTLRGGEVSRGEKVKNQNTRRRKRRYDLEPEKREAVKKHK